VCGISGFPEEFGSDRQNLDGLLGRGHRVLDCLGFLCEADTSAAATAAKAILPRPHRVVAVVLINTSTRRINLDRAVLPHTLVTGIVADVLALVGLSLAIWARVTLGGNWSARVTLKENHELIQRGPYRLVRHPIYSGLLLMILGTAVLAGRVGGFIALAFCFCGFWVKLRQEERLLAQHLSGYSEYMRRTKALVPFIL
jgi:protein-S-isoprenylcysteine O-methyltransferase Ste14